MALIPDVNATEKWPIENTLRRRHGEKVDEETSLRMPKFVGGASREDSPSAR
ncbi:MAG: hypothetical protein PVJ14_01655 [Chromatiales bacterium]|jgi:hypothetical protein